MPRRCHVLRVFTRGSEGGNHLGVVTELTGLSPALMQAIATDLGFSETAFVDQRHDQPPAVRIFTPATELSFAGHPLVGVAWWLLGPGGHGRLRTALREVSTKRDEDGRCWVGSPLDWVVRAAPARPGAVSVEEVAMAQPYLLVEMASPAQVAAVQPMGPGYVYVYAWERPGSIKARFFASEAGISEDPATGSAALALAAVLAGKGRVEGAVEIHQGEEVGRPCTIHLRWRDAWAWIGGSVLEDEVRRLEV